MIDRRAASRRSLYIPARLYLDDDEDGIGCLILDSSDEGLGIELELLGEVPKALAAAKQVTVKLNNGELIQAVKQWNQGLKLGLKLAKSLPL